MDLAKVAGLLFAIILFSSVAFAAECEIEKFVDECCSLGEERTPLEMLQTLYRDYCTVNNLERAEPDALMNYFNSNYQVTMETPKEGMNVPIVEGLIVNGAFAEEMKNLVPPPSNELDECMKKCMAEKGSTEDACFEFCRNIDSEIDKEKPEGETTGMLDSGFLLLIVGILLGIVIVVGGVAGFLYLRGKDNEILKQMKLLKKKINSLEKSYLKGQMDEITYRRLMEQYQMQLNELKVELSKKKH